MAKNNPFYTSTHLHLIYDYCRILCLVSSMGVRIKIVQQLAHPWFLVFVGLYLGQLALVTQEWSIPLLRNYLGDVLAFPIILHLITVSIRLILNTPSFRADWTMLVSLWILIVIVFEGVLPPINPRYTADYWDMLAYGLGLLLAYVAFIK